MLRAGADYRPLRHRTLAMIFEKASTRTRVSFETGMVQFGGHALFLSPRDTQLGRGEPIEDNARVLSRMVDAVMIRTFKHETLERFAAHSRVPVINGLSDLAHPCQLLADMQTYLEHRGDIRGRRVAWIGDGNNVCNSYINAARVFDFQLRIACPEGFEPNPAVLAAAGERCEILRDPREAAGGADLVATDVWASMGQEEEQRLRDAAFAGYQVNEAVMAARRPGCPVHALPAGPPRRRGQRRGHRRAPVGRLGRGGKPPARAEGLAGNAALAQRLIGACRVLPAARTCAAACASGPPQIAPGHNTHHQPPRSAVRRLPLLLICLCALAEAQAETRYVTDQCSVPHAQGGGPQVQDLPDAAERDHARGHRGQPGQRLYPGPHPGRHRRLCRDRRAPDRARRTGSPRGHGGQAGGAAAGPGRPGRASSATLQSEQQELKTEHEHVSRERDRLEQELATLRSASANIVEITNDRAELRTRVAELTRQAADLEQENRDLNLQTNQRWFLIGAGVVGAGSSSGSSCPTSASGAARAPGVRSNGIRPSGHRSLVRGTRSAQLDRSRTAPRAALVVSAA